MRFAPMLHTYAAPTQHIQRVVKRLTHPGAWCAPPPCAAGCPARERCNAGACPGTARTRAKEVEGKGASFQAACSGPGTRLPTILGLSTISASVAKHIPPPSCERFHATPPACWSSSAFRRPPPAPQSRRWAPNKSAPAAEKSRLVI